MRIPDVTRSRRSATACFDDLLCRTLRGEDMVWPEAAGGGFQDGLLESAAYHGVGPLLYSRLSTASAWNHMPQEVREKIRRAAHDQAALELIRRREIHAVLDALTISASRIPILMKGLPLAYTLYPSPALRPRADTDLLVAPGDVTAVSAAFESLGYRRPNAVSGQFVSSQFSYYKTGECGVVHAFDVHWRINNSNSFANALTFDEVEAESMPIPALAERARALGSTHALLLACIHRISHAHTDYGANRLIWIYDIHLLGQSMARAEWERFVSLAREKALCSVCLDGLSVAQKKFGSTFPQDFVDAIVESAERETIRLDRLLSSPWWFVLSEFRSLSSWRHRIALFREHVFPPASYMLNKYEVRTRGLLPFLYAYRALNGLRRWGLFQRRRLFGSGPRG